MNEETILKNSQMANSQQAGVDNQGVAWKQVTLGGVSGILMGAGMLYAGQIAAKELGAEDPSEVQAPKAGETSHTLENGLQVAAVSDDLSFGEAFAQARAEVGPGGVFHWHGGIYNTYSAEEWNAMTIEQKHVFAQQVQPEIHPDELSTPTDANTHVVVVHHVYHHDQEVHPNSTATDDVQVVSQQPAGDSDSDVHIIGYATIKGHLAVGLDMDNDGQADVAIIDVDDNQQLSDPDLVIDKDGNYATIGQLNDNDPNMDVTSDSSSNEDYAQSVDDYPLYDI